MIAIHCNVSGTPTDTPLLVVDTGARANGDLSVPGRCSFRLPNGTPPHGATLTWNGRTARTVIALRPGVPLAPGDYEGGQLYEPIPTLDYGPPELSALRVEGDHFVVAATGRRWWWKGATDMLLPARLEAGENISPILDQRRNAGATIIRALAMGYPFWPSGAPVQFATVRRFFEMTATARVYIEWVIFAGTRTVMPRPDAQLRFYQETLDVVRAYPHVLVELLNEQGHGTQQIDPQIFPRPGGVLASHGSGLTDASPVTPLWDFATYHPRRDRPPDSRGFTNYDPFAFQNDWPKPCPFIPDEGIKPQEYGFNPEWAAQMGRHAAHCAGGTFHSDAGVRSLPWTPEEVRCAEAFYSAIGDVVGMSAASEDSDDRAGIQRSGEVNVPRRLDAL